MKVAIIHDVFIEFGGAERVLIALLSMYPTADVYVPLITGDRNQQLKKLTSGAIVTSALNHIPFVHSASILLKPLLYLYWETLDLTKYDLVISSSHSFSSKSVITSPKTLHVSYIHTPPRYLYAEYNETRILRHKIWKILLSPLLSWLRTKDFIGAQRPDILIANSKTVQARIKKYYRRDSVVIYPPVRIPKKIMKRRPKYFLCVSRLAKQKGIDLAIRACNELKEALVIVGIGSEERYLRSIAGPTINFLGAVPDENMAPVWAGAKALIYPSIEEDFGIVPVEAMAHGVPVIAYNSGGVTETIIHKKTGIFFEKWTVDDLTDKLRLLKSSPLSSLTLIKSAKHFSEFSFTKKLSLVIS